MDLNDKAKSAFVSGASTLWNTESCAKVIGQGNRLESRIQADERDFSLKDKALGLFFDDRLIKDQLGRGDLFENGVACQDVCIARRAFVNDGAFAHRVEVPFFLEFRDAQSPVLEELGPRLFKIIQIAAIVNNAAGVRVVIINTFFHQVVPFLKARIMT